MDALPLVVDIIFWVFAGIAIAGGLGVVLLRDIFKAAIALLFSLLASAGLFVVLNGEFIGAIQVLVNVGAVAILLIVTIMVVRDIAVSAPIKRRAAGAAGFTVALLTLVAIGVTAYGTDWVATIADGASVADEVSEALTGEGGLFSNSIEATGTLLLRDFLLPLQIVGLIIAAAVVGAVALMRGTLDDSELDEVGGA